MTVRIALVGCGAAARRLHLPGFRGVADVVAFTSASRASAEAAAAEWGGGDVVGDWREVVARDDVDAVVVCTPNDLHAPVAVAAARAGKHVLVEKPIARTLDEADEMIDAAARAGVVLSVAHNTRYAPPFPAMRAAVAAGAIGEVVSFRAALCTEGPAVWAPGSTWFTDPVAAGGGALLDIGVHVTDVVRAVTGLEAVEVTAMTFPPGATVEAGAHAVVRLGNGAAGSMTAAWNARPGPDHLLTVTGTEGTLYTDARTPGVLLRPGSDAEPLPDVSAGDPYAAFAHAIERGEQPEVRGADGRAALAIVRAAYDSAATGSTVKVR